MPRLLIFAFALLLFVELPGSWLAEPDEARYAEVPREMLATGDWVTPRLNGMHYFEKPVLLYWANAASMSVIGQNPYGARLPTRLAALGIVAMLMLMLGVGDDRETGAWAALIFLAMPLGFALGRFVLTDMLLASLMTLTFLAQRRFLLERERERPAGRWLALVGLGAGLSVLTKGLVGIVLPGLVLVLWAGLTSRWRRIAESLLSPAPLVFLAVAAPWFVAVERASPGFNYIFFVREHLLRYATPESKRGGPIYYFLAVFIAGFLPWTFLLRRVWSRLQESRRARGLEWLDDLYVALWFGVIFVFFSISRSKLIPYLLPAMPAAAILAARAIRRTTHGWSRTLLVYAVVISIVIMSGLGYGLASGQLRSYGGVAYATLGGAALVGGAWWAVVLARRDASSRPWLAAAAGWLVFYLALVLVLPHVSEDLSDHSLAVTAASVSGASVVAYRNYPQSFPWVMQRYIGVADYKGELSSDGADPGGALLTADEFWKRWRDRNPAAPVVAVVRRRDLQDFRTHAHDSLAEVASNRKLVLVSNVPLSAATR
jgi:4-amino-4-deoxy-L-arabinose transferase-like glycosyltransferase